MSDYKKIIDFELKKEFLPEKWYTEERLKDMNRFYKILQKFVLHLLELNTKNDSYLKDEMQEKLEIFRDIYLEILKSNKHSLLYYMIVFKKMIDSSDMRDVKSENITSEAIEELTNKNVKIDYYLLLTVDISTRLLWFLASDKDVFVKFLNSLYGISYIFIDKHLTDVVEFVFKDIKLPCCIYKESIYGSGETIKIFMKDSVLKADITNDNEYKEKLIDDSQDIVNKSIRTFEKYGIKSEEDFNMSEKGINPDIDKVLYEISDNVKSKDKDRLIDIGLVLLTKYGENPNMFRENAEIKMIMNIIIISVEEQLKKGHKLKMKVEKFYKVIKTIFYDKDVQFDPKLRRMLMNAQKKYGKVKFKKH